MTDLTPNAQTQTADITSPIVTGDNPQPAVSSPVVEPAARVDPNAAVEPVVGADPAAAAPAVDPNADANKVTPEWIQKRINELTAKRYEAERREAAAIAKATAAETKAAELLAQIGNRNPDPNASTQPTLPANITEEEIERRVEEKAIQKAAAARFNDACNTIVETGKKEYAATWDDAVKNLSLVGAIGQGVSPEFLETAIELKNPAKILHYLGTNLEEAERIAKLPPKRMALEMARVEATVNAPPAPVAAPVLPPVSNAPAPVIPVGGAAKPGPKSIDDPSLSVEEFMALRAQMRDERQKRYQR